MSEITKLYENAGIKPLCQIPDKYCGVQNVYADFTAKKQIELIKWLLYNAKVDCLNMFYKDEENYLEISINCKNGYSYENSFDDNFEIAMASVINTLWQSLTSEEKQQIKEILE